MPRKWSHYEKGVSVSMAGHPGLFGGTPWLRVFFTSPQCIAGLAGATLDQLGLGRRAGELGVSRPGLLGGATWRSWRSQREISCSDAAVFSAQGPA